MRRISGIWVITLCVAGAAFAQAPEPAQPAKDAAVHNELRALQKAMEDALNSRDLDALLANVDDDLVFTAMNAESGYGKQHVRDYFNRMLNGPDKVVDKISVDFIPDKLAVFYGPDVAVSAGKAESHYELTNGMKFDVTARWTGTLVHKQGRWLVGSFHYSANIFDNPVLTIQRNYLIAGGAGGALVLGVLGFFIGRKTGRR